MNACRFFVLATGCAFLLTLSSCEKKTTEPASNPQQAAEKVDQGNRILVPRIVLLVNSEGSDTSAFNVSQAASLYNEALAADPNNRHAHFGLALTDILSLGSDPQVRSLFASNRIIVSPAALRSFFAGKGVSQPLSDITSRFRNRIFNAHRQTVSPFLAKGSSVTQNEPPSYYQNLVELLLLPRLTSAINHLLFVAQDANYVLLITPEMTGDTQTYRIDLTEIYVLLTVLQFVTADASALVAYNIDYNSADSASVHNALQPSSAFLAFRTGGGQRMRDARTNFVGMATSIQAGLNFLMNEPANPHTDLIEYNPNDAAAFVEAIAIADTVKLVLSGSYAIPNGPTVNLKNFFDDAIPNYKQLLPAYTAAAQFNAFSSRYDGIITWNAATFDAWIFPDPTMRGLFPGMTDMQLKQWMELTLQNYSQTVVIPG